MTERHIVILTGMSGAGKSHALKSFEDAGYEAVDNIPLTLLNQVVGKDDGFAPRKLALGIDVRSRHFSSDTLFAILNSWCSNSMRRTTLLFLDCENDILLRRFTETRRKHPLAQDRPVLDGITLERELLSPLRSAADNVINTSNLTGHDLKRYIHEHFAAENSELLVFLTSFSFREGLPRDADMVVDVRFLRNPHYDEALRPLNGKDTPVADFISKDESFEEFFTRLCALLEPLLPRYRAEGKSYFTLAIGCTGGKHRSVFVVEKLAGFFGNLGYKHGIRHRDLK